MQGAIRNLDEAESKLSCTQSFLPTVPGEAPSIKLSRRISILALNMQQSKPTGSIRREEITTSI